jgi:CheY-like chemotaxis protein
VRGSSEGVGRGATFVIELPLAAAPAGPDPVAGVPEPGALTILVVDDNEDAAVSLADMLGLLGHRVRVVLRGEDAVAEASRRMPEVLICDLGLPDLGGHDVIRAIRAQPGGERVFALALSGYAQPQDREDAVSAGFDGHLAKPPDLAALTQWIAAATGS